MTTRSEVTKRMMVRDIALDGCGIGAEVEQELREGMADVAGTAAAFIKSASGQLAYNLLTNKPCGVELRNGETPARHAIEHGLITTLSGLIKWDIYEARRLAAELLEDANDHEEAAKLFELAKGKAEQC